MSVVSQNNVTVNNSGVDTNSSNSMKPKVLLKTPSFHKLIVEIYNAENFDYQDFLATSENSKMSYRVGNHSYSKKELAKVFRKAAKRSETVYEFEDHLNNINPQLILNLSDTKTIAIYRKFREGTFHAYVDELSTSGIVFF